ncbi:transcobalamin beta b [Danio aesculapii]|uniref:transcobalamin beta b n=1 Tax=Danio aesculapii TaxID=1142201 RepID=UPI0024BF3D5A|nr:transcobalamin beta b [Danio aesculapii]
MTLTAITLLCFAALLPFPGLGRGGNSGEQHGVVSSQVSINVVVSNKFANELNTYPVTAPKGMPIFGILNQLQDNNQLNFTYSISKSYGIFLESVNGLAGSTENKTYWELLSKRNKKTTPLNVGIGCYQPEKNENFIMNFTTWA